MSEKLIARYRHIVTNVVSSDHRVREGIEQYKAEFRLADGSNLRVSEVYIDRVLTKYSYYWLDESDKLISGWDNAPHHPEIKSHPHHLHVGVEVHESSVRNLADVLALLAERLSK